MAAPISSFRQDSRWGRSSRDYSSSLSNSKRVAQRSYADAIRQGVNNSFCVSYGNSFLRKRSIRRLCFRCGGSDHIVKDCRNKSRCFHCGGFGHRKILCSEFYRGKSKFEFLHYIYSRLCQKLISFIILFDLSSSNQKDEGAYMLLLLGWYFEGFVDGLLWLKGVLGVSSNVIYPPLPRPPERKEHAISFCINFLKLRRLFTDSVSMHKKKGLLLLNDIMMHFDIINTAVNCARGDAVYQGFSKSDDDSIRRLESCFKQKGVVSKTDVFCDLVGDMVNELYDGSLFCEDVMVVLSERCLVSQHMDLMVLDPFVQYCVGNSELVEGRGLEWMREDTGNEMMMDTVSVDPQCLETTKHMDSSTVIDLEKEGECIAKVDLDGYSMESQKRVGASNMVLGYQSSVIHSIIKNGMLDLDCGKNCSSQGNLVVSKEFISFSKHLVVDRTIKRRRTSSVMKQDLWLAMNKGMCMSSVLLGLRDSHSQIGDRFLVGLQEDNGEKAHVSDLSITLSRRGRRRTVYPRSGLVRRSTRIRSYTGSGSSVSF